MSRGGRAGGVACDAGVAGEDDLGAGPAVAVGGLVVFAEGGLGSFVGVGMSVIDEEEPAKTMGNLRPEPWPP